MPDSDAPQENDPWADLPTPEQAALTPPPLPTVEIRPPVEDDPNPPAAAPALPPDSTAASQDTVSLHIPTEPVEPPPTVFTGPPTGLADPTVAVPPIVAAPDFVAEAPPEPDEPSETPDESAAPLVDRTGRDTAAVVWAGLGILIWVGAIGAAWWALTRGADPIVDEVSLPTPQTTFETLSDMVGDNGFWDNIVRTAFRLVGAVVLGAAAGLSFGQLIGSAPRLGRLVQPLPALLRLATPVVFFPILLIWWGLDVPLIVVPALAVFASVSFSTATVVADARRGWGGAVGPGVVSGIRSALPLAWASLAFVEVVSARTGVMASMWQSRNFLRVDELLIWLGVVLLLALVIDLLLRLVQHLVRPGRRDDVPPPLR